jgi:L-threonylcarbamoyladenylate synthase
MSLKEAVAALRRGLLVVLPTDTVYGVASLPSRAGTTALFAAKSRPEDKAIPILGAALGQLQSIAVFDERARRLAQRFWPGPLTLVLPRAPGFDVDLGGNDRTTVAVRVPDHGVALALLAETGPLAVTSANRSGEPPASSVDEARAVLGETVAVYVDGGSCGGRGSTVVSVLDGLKVLREGPITASELRQ